MQFPLELLIGYFEQQGTTVLQTPSNPQARFSWISVNHPANAYQHSSTMGMPGGNSVHVLPASMRRLPNLTQDDSAGRQSAEEPQGVEHEHASQLHANRTVDTTVLPSLRAPQVLRHQRDISLRRSLNPTEVFHLWVCTPEEAAPLDAEGDGRLRHETLGDCRTSNGLSSVISDGSINRPSERHRPAPSSGNPVPPDPLAGDHVNDIWIVSDRSPLQIADELQWYLIRIIQWQDQVSELLESDCDCQDLLEASEPLLRCYIGLSDSTFSYIAHTPGIKPIDDVSRQFVENKFYDPDVVDKAHDAQQIRRWKNKEGLTVKNGPNRFIPYETLNRPIRRDGTYSAHLIMVSPVAITPNQVFVFDLLARKIELCLIHHWQFENPLEQRYTYFLKELLAGNTYDDGFLGERALLHGIPLTGLFELCLVDNEDHVGSVNYFSQQILLREPNCKVAIEGNQVAVLLCADDGCSDKIDVMERTVFRLATSMRLEVGVSDHFKSIDQAALALEMTRIALDYGHRKSRKHHIFEDELPESGHVFRFRRYFPYYAVDPFVDSKAFITKLLASPHALTYLKDRDHERNTNDYEILRVYLRSECRINTVCNILHLHRNTMNYRLEKIRNAIELDLDDPDVRMYLRLLYFLDS